MWPSGGVEGVTVAAILTAAKCIGSTENTVDNLMAQYDLILPKVREYSEAEVKAQKKAGRGA